MATIQISKHTNYLNGQVIAVIMQQLEELRDNNNISYLSMTSLPTGVTIDITYHNEESEAK